MPSFEATKGQGRHGHEAPLRLGCQTRSMESIVSRGANQAPSGGRARELMETEML